MKKNYILLCGIIMLFVIHSCKDNYDFSLETLTSNSMDLSTDVSLPIAYATITLTDILEEDENIIFGSDNLVSIVYSEDSLCSFIASEFYETPEIDPVTEDFEIGLLDIDNFNIELDISLNSLCNNINEGKDIKAVGGTTAYFVPIALQSAGTYTYDVFDDFQYAKFEDGYMEFTVTNNLPVALKNIEFTVRDAQNNNEAVFDDALTFDLIAVGATVTVTKNLAGVEMSNELELRIESFESSGSGDNPLNKDNWVYIDLTSSLTVQASLEDLKLSEGTAFFSNKTLDPDTTEIDFSDDSDEKITKIILKSGYVEIELRSEVKADVDVNLRFPSMTKNGVVKETTIPVNYTGLDDPETETIDISGCTIDLTQGSDPDKAYNTLPVAYDLRNNSDSYYVEFTSEDKIYVKASFHELYFEYVEGYFGQKTIEIDAGTIDLGVDIFDQIEGGLTLTDPQINMIVKNSVGIAGQVDLNLTAVSSSGETETINPQIELSSITATNPYQTDIIEFNKNTMSNLVDFIALPPQIINYEAETVVNPDGDTGELNFVSDTSKIQVGIEIDMPLELKTSNLAFRDTMDMDLGDEIDDAENGTLYITSTNGFPFEISVDLIMYDSGNDLELDTISATLLKAASVTDGKVTDGDKTEYTEPVEILKRDMELLKQADKIIIVGSLTTTDDGTVAVKLYSDYTLDINLAMNLTYNFDTSN